MGRLNEKDEERLRSLLVEMLLEFRRLYLDTSGCKRLEYWRMLLDAFRDAATSTANTDAWATSIQHSLRIEQLGNSACSTLLELSSFVRERSAFRDLRRLCREEYGLLEALGRKINEEQKAKWEAEHAG